MTEPHSKTSVLLTLPRPQQPLPPRSEAVGEYHPSVAEMLLKAWANAEPTHAWIRYTLSTGVGLRDFQQTYRGLHGVKRAFGRRVVMSPVRIDHHEIELPDFLHSANPETGGYEMELVWRTQRVYGGAHLLFAVESDQIEGKRDHSIGLEILDALEASARFGLGAMAVVETRQTSHLELATGLQYPVEPSFRVYGEEEAPRADADAISAVTDLAQASDRLTVSDAGRVSLGMRWANIAFKANDLLAFWTAIEILAGCRGRKAYSVIAQAYGLDRANGQSLAKSMGVDFIYRMRGDLTHNGRAIHMDPRGASFLFALVHDLARYASGLPPKQLAERLLAGRRVEDWFRPEVYD